jgi:hypothetical protein
MGMLPQSFSSILAEQEAPTMGEAHANRDPHIEVPITQTRTFSPIVGQEAQINKEVQESGGSRIEVPMIGVSQNVSSVIRTEDIKSYLPLP